VAELERIYISQGKDWYRGEDDGGLGGGRNKDERWSFRWDMLSDAPKSTCVDINCHSIPFL